jgi:hypothetical protein
MREGVKILEAWELKPKTVRLQPPEEAEAGVERTAEVRAMRTQDPALPDLGGWETLLLDAQFVTAYDSVETCEWRGAKGLCKDGVEEADDRGPV